MLREKQLINCVTRGHYMPSGEQLLILGALYRKMEGLGQARAHRISLIRNSRRRKENALQTMQCHKIRRQIVPVRLSVERLGPF